VKPVPWTPGEPLLGAPAGATAAAKAEEKK
jgi:hypothetical protein